MPIIIINIKEKMAMFQAKFPIEKNNSGCPIIEKNDKINETGEYNIPPYKGFPSERRGEPCVHPAFSDSLNLLDPIISRQKEL